VNLFHRWYCGSRRWAAVVEGSLLPWVLDGVELGPRLLEIGPGPGLTTDHLRHRAASLTAVELDPALAARLPDRLRSAGFGDVSVTTRAGRLRFRARRQ
jgi:protein-L-isoaspartate O-methyltransferase